MLDPTIALQARGPEYQSPVAQYAKLLQLKDLTRQGQLGDMQFQQAQEAAKRDAEWRTALSGNDLGKPEGLAALMRVDPVKALAIQKDQLGARKTEADIAHLGGQTAKDSAATAQTLQQTKTAAFNQHLQELSGVDSPDGAAAWVQRGLKRGIGDMQTASEAMRQIPTDPAAFAQWKRAQMMAGVDLAKQFDLANADRTHGLEVQKFGETGRHNKATELNAAGQLGVAQGQLGLSRQRLAFDQSQPKGQYDADRGLLIDPRTAQAQPVTMGGAPIGAKDKPLAEGAQKQVLGARNTQDAVTNYLEKMNAWTKGKMISPEARAEMGTAYNNMLLQAKEAYNLGVLNGPDYKILQDVVRDPSNPTSLVFSNESMANQASELRRISQNIEKNVMEAHGKPYTPRAPAGGKEPTASAGVPDDIAAILRKHGGK